MALILYWTVLFSPSIALAQPIPGDIRLIAGSPEQRLAAVIELCAASRWQELSIGLLDPSALVRRYVAGCWDPREGGVEALHILVGDDDPAVRIAVAGALGRSLEPQAIDWLSRLLTDSEASVRASAAGSYPLGALTQDPSPLLSLLEDTSWEVLAITASRLEPLHLRDRLSTPQRLAFDRGIRLHALLRGKPEVFGVLVQWHRQADRLERRLLRTAEYSGSCVASAREALQSARSRLDGRIFSCALDKVETLLHPLRRLQAELLAIERGFNFCRDATLLSLSFDGATSTDDARRRFAARAQLDTTWVQGFPDLRVGLESSEREGELWARSLLAASLFWPDRPVAAVAPTSEPSLATALLLVRDQLFRHSEYSGFHGGGMIRGRLPVGCFVGAHCRLAATAQGLLTPGETRDYPESLVAPHRRLGGDLTFDLTSLDLSASLFLGASHLRYREPRFQAAGYDQLFAGLLLDSSFQARLAFRRHQYASTGPAGASDAEGGIARNRDGTLVDALVGTRLGDPGQNQILQFIVMGGVSLPFLDAEAFDTDPQLTMDLSLRLQNREEHSPGRFARLTIGGRRRLEPSPHNFALQNFLESYLEFVYRGLDPPRSGIEIEVGLSYDLLSLLAPISGQAAFEISRVMGGAEIRLLLDRWIGLGLANWTMGTASSGQPYQINNRFLLSVFLPLGGYGFDLEETTPW
ncbi:MAG: HEAT repeat domain-containing protein [Bradymonadales bacterium]|nr:HEAT repeat domain-containing protein [Bradymonadales bacterium]